jgi:hypothetical protein
VITVHRTGFIAVQACPVAGECNQIPHTTLPRGRGSERWRMSTVTYAAKLKAAPPPYASYQHCR